MLRARYMSWFTHRGRSPACWKLSLTNVLIYDE
jgi:hypothetical protein